MARLSDADVEHLIASLGGPLPASTQLERLNRSMQT